MGRGRENQVLRSMYQVDDNSDGGDDVATLVANMVSTAMVASILMSYQSQEGGLRQQNNGWEYQHAKKEFDRDDDYETVMIRSF